MSYLPPILRRSRFGGSPGQIIIVVVLVALALMVYSRSGDPSVLIQSASRLAILFPALILSLALHEAAHSAAATALGDNTSRRLGRLTLNPLAHLDPLGTMMLVITVILGFGIGWAKPVPVNPRNFSISPRVGMALVALAGPVTNILIAFVAVRLIIGLPESALPVLAMDVLRNLAFLNIALAVFNMLPFPPLDGYRVLLGILPDPMARSYEAIEPYGPMILMLVIFMGSGFLSGLIGAVAGPLIRVMAA